ncbi:hypothetical protein B5M09_014037, partial [Aphanomyces astaci]
MLEALKTKTEVDVVQLAKTWKGYAMDEQPVYADVTANLRIRLSTAAGPVNLPGVQLCYVISRSDSLLISRYALQSIGIDMNHLLEQVAQHQSHEDGDDDDVGEPDEDEDIAFGVATRLLQGGEQGLDKLDEDAAVSLLEKAFETFKITDAGKHVKTHKLKDIVMQASAKGVWRAQFRGTDEAANVPAMDIKLKADAQPHRCKARKSSPLETKFLDAFGNQLEEDGIIYSNSSSAYCSPVNPVMKPSGKKLLKTSGEWTTEELLLHYRLTIDCG